MNKREKGWISTISSSDAAVLWEKLYALISKHSSVKGLYSASRFTRDRLQDIYSDLTQDLFLHLHQKDRLQFYIDEGYTDENVEHELYRLEIPNLVSKLLKERFPESYRLSRRTSILLQSHPDFKHYPEAYRMSHEMRLYKSASSRLGLLSRIYGLSCWSPEKPMKGEQEMKELTREVAVRQRDIRRTGRGSGSQIIISNEELRQLIVDIFVAIDSPADVRTMRMLVLSKLAIEDSSFISVDAERIQESATESEWLRVDLPDSRPTPEEVLIKKEAMWQMDSMAEDLLTSLKKRVRNKPQRYRKLLRVVWHCYFDPSSPSQTSVARMMGISNSLVSHYRKIFDDFIQGIELSDEEGVMLDGALSARLSAIIWDAEADRAEKAPAREYPSPFISPAKPLVVVASVASPGRT